MRKKYIWACKCFCLFILGICCVACQSEVFLSPGSIAFDTDRQLVYTALSDCRAIAVTDLQSKKGVGRIRLKERPNRLLLSPDGRYLYVSCGKAEGTVEIFRLPQQEHLGTIAVGHTPEGMALSPDGMRLYVANRFSNTVDIIDLRKREVTKRIPASREPHTLEWIPGSKLLAVANLLPVQAATAPCVAAEITLVDTQEEKVSYHLVLEDGAQSVRGLVCSADGHFLYVSHLLSRYKVPITQLDRGWVNTNALTVIDLEKKEVYATLLLDDVNNGAANPAGLCVTSDNKLYVAISGTHELLEVDLARMHDDLSRFLAGDISYPYISGKEELSKSLNYLTPFKRRIPLYGRSPRFVVCAGHSIIVSSRFSTFLELYTLSNGNLLSISLGEESCPDAVRRGEMAFCDASACYQHWQSCISCHPDGRTDGMNWDQQNDGLGNPKNTKSMLFSYVTPPAMVTGVRVSAAQAVRKGIQHILNASLPATTVADMDAYLQSLQPEISPFLSESEENLQLQKGREIFEEAKCSVCHLGKYGTDGRSYDVGTGTGGDKGRRFDTPSLRELWRTAPYLYDGRAKTIREVLWDFNSDNRHGLTRSLTEEELKSLELYLLTL